MAVFKPLSLCRSRDHRNHHDWSSFIWDSPKSCNVHQAFVTYDQILIFQHNNQKTQQCQQAQIRIDTMTQWQKPFGLMC